MPVEAYSPCPCGSGKKFKWCCQPIYVDINRAFQLDADGQHEAALKIMEAVVRDHSANPEAHGRQGELLFVNDRVEAAEAALEKAFALNPDYPYGHLLRGQFRLHEGELAGAILLFRKAAERYDPEAREALASVYMLIADCETKLNRPVAGRAALEIMLRLRPDEEARRGFEEAFGETSQLPLSARRKYTFQSPPADAPAARRTAWNQALAGTDTGRLADAVRAFEQLTAANGDAAAWYNLGVARAWMGNNAAALEALARSVELETDEARAAEAWALGEVLRLGQGMEDQADYVQHTLFIQIRDPQTLVKFLQQWQQERRLIAQMHEEQGVISGVVLDKVTALTAESAAAKTPGLVAHLMIIADLFQLWSLDADKLAELAAEVRQRAGNAFGQADQRRGPAGFRDLLLGAQSVPLSATSKEEVEQRRREYARQYFEETWVQRPLRSLGGVPPVDAAGHGTLRKKLAGAVQFLEECSATLPDQAYDFDRLRRKLSLLPDAAPPAAAGGVPVDITALGAAELAALSPESLTDEQAEQAFQTALRLDARELARRFGTALVARPVRPERSDRYPWYAQLVRLALAEGDTAAALDHLNEGEKADCEQNEGRRRNDFELARGQVHAKRGETDAARDVFERLLARVPAELKYRVSAAEALLSARQGAAALAFAEQGLALARQQNSRDFEGHFLELVAAAKKQAG